MSHSEGAAQTAKPVANYREQHVAMLASMGLTPDLLGEFVRDAWVRWAKTQPDPKPSWLVPWSELNETDREADRCIGRSVALMTLAHDNRPAAPCSCAALREENARLDAMNDGQATLIQKQAKRIEELEAAYVSDSEGLRARIAALTRDLEIERERVDWLENGRRKIGHAFSDRGDGYYLKTEPSWTFLGGDWREAIDAARSALSAPASPPEVTNG